MQKQDIAYKNGQAPKFIPKKRIKPLPKGRLKWFDKDATVADKINKMTGEATFDHEDDEFFQLPVKALI